MDHSPHWTAGNLLFVLPRGLGDSIVSLLALQFLAQFRPQGVRLIAAAPSLYLSFFRALKLPADYWVESDNEAALEEALDDIDIILDCSGCFLSGKDLIQLAAGGRAFSTYSHSAFMEVGANMGNFNLTRIDFSEQGLHEISRVRSPFIDSYFGEPEPAFYMELRLIYWFLYGLELTDKFHQFKTLVWRIDVTAETPLIYDVCLCPGGSDPLKKWPIDHVKLLVEKLSQKGLRVKVLLGPCEADAADELRRVHADVIFPEDILQLGLEIERSELVVANDCGPMHVAGALGKPLLAIFGPTNPVVWFCYNQPSQSYIKGQASDWREIGVHATPKVLWPSVDLVLARIESHFAST